VEAIMAFSQAEAIIIGALVTGIFAVIAAFIARVSKDGTGLQNRGNISRDRNIADPGGTILDQNQKAIDEFNRIQAARRERERMVKYGVDPSVGDPPMRVPRSSSIAWNIFATLALVGIALAIYWALGGPLPRFGG
jgi:hypothetical protein